MIYSLKNNIRLNPEATIRDYFGEKIAMYFSFLAYYRDMLMGPLIWGLALTLYLIFYRFV